MSRYWKRNGPNLRCTSRFVVDVNFQLNSNNLTILDILEEEEKNILGAHLNEEDEDFDDEFKRVGRDDLFDPEVDKYYLDPWSEPYFYRENKSKRTKEDWMLKRRGFDLWSVGPDGVNDACFGHPEEDEEYDDIGNW